MELRTLEVFLKELKTFARILYPEFDTGEGSILNDLLFRVHAFAGELLMQELLKVQAQIRMTELSGTDLEEEARKYGIERRSGFRARGKVAFYTRTSPPSIGILIPSSTVVTSSGGLEVLMYRTVEDKTIFPTDYRIDTGRYEVEIMVEAEDVGSKYNIGVGMIRRLQAPLPGIDGVENYEPIVGGTDIETDEELKERLLKRMLGRNFGSVLAYESLVEDNFEVADAKVISPYEEGYLRVTGPDIVVIYEKAFSKIDIFEFNHSVNPEQIFIVTSQPIQDVTQVLINGTPIGSDEYQIIKDEGFRVDSIFAKDGVKILRTLNDGDEVSISYRYSAIYEIQNFLMDASVRVPSIDIWVRNGRRFNLDITLQVGFISGVNVTDEKKKITDALSAMLSTYDLGQPIDRSDIVSAVQKGFSDLVITSVDFVRIVNWEAEDAYGNQLVEENGRLIPPIRGFIRLGKVMFI